MKDMLIYPKWMNILNVLYENKDGKRCLFHTSFLANKCNVTYSHCHKVIKYLEEQKYLEITKPGREHIIVFTDKGLQKACLCHNLIADCKNGEKLATILL